MTFSLVRLLTRRISELLDQQIEGVYAGSGVGLGWLCQFGNSKSCPSRIGCGSENNELGLLIHLIQVYICIKANYETYSAKLCSY